jgi:hypothetical protein
MRASIQQGEKIASFRDTNILGKQIVLAILILLTEVFCSLPFFAIIGQPNYSPFINMDNDLVLFFVGVAVLVLYLVFSAITEMGTKLPWKK